MEYGGNEGRSANGSALQPAPGRQGKQQIHDCGTGVEQPDLEGAGPQSGGIHSHKGDCAAVQDAEPGYVQYEMIEVRTMLGRNRARSG